MLYLGDPVVVVALPPRGNMLSPLSIVLQGRGGPPFGGAWHAGRPSLLRLPQQHLLLMLLNAPCRQTASLRCRGFTLIAGVKGFRQIAEWGGGT